jgi:hypothetical protein
VWLVVGVDLRGARHTSVPPITMGPYGGFLAVSRAAGAVAELRRSTTTTS